MPRKTKADLSAEDLIALEYLRLEREARKESEERRIREEQEAAAAAAIRERSERLNLDAGMEYANPTWGSWAMICPRCRSHVSAEDEQAAVIHGTDCKLMPN